MSKFRYSPDAAAGLTLTAQKEREAKRPRLESEAQTYSSIHGKTSNERVTGNEASLVSNKSDASVKILDVDNVKSMRRKAEKPEPSSQPKFPRAHATATNVQNSSVVHNTKSERKERSSEKKKIIEIDIYDSDVEVVLHVQAPEKKTAKKSKSEVVFLSSGNTKNTTKEPPQKVPNSQPLIIKDKEPLPAKSDAAIHVDLTEDNLLDLTLGSEDEETTPTKKFHSPGHPPTQVKDAVVFIGTTTPTKPPPTVSSPVNRTNSFKKSIKPSPPVSYANPFGVSKKSPAVKPLRLSKKTALPYNNFSFKVAPKPAPQTVSAKKVAWSSSTENVARLPQMKRSLFADCDGNYSSDDDIGKVLKRRRKKQQKKKKIYQGTDDRKPAAEPRATSFGEQVSLARRPPPLDSDASSDKKQSPTPWTKTSPPVASRDSTTKTNVLLNPRGSDEGVDDKSHGTGGGIANEYGNPYKVEEFLKQIMLSDDDPPYSYEEYSELLLKVEDSIQLQLEEIEHGRGVEWANHHVSIEDSSNQKSAMYGSLEPKMIKHVAEYAGLTKEKTFVDVGSGTGKVCNLVGFCYGCPTKGIELVQDRYVVGEELLKELIHLHNENFVGDSSKKRAIGDVNYRHGRMEDLENRDFLVDGTDVMLCNNAHNVFSDRSELKGTTFHLNHILVGLFLQMKPGSVLITLDKLPIGPDCNAVYQRRRNNKLARRDETPADCSFFIADEKTFEEDELVSWTYGQGVTVYRYTRTKIKEPKILCSNPKCEKARNSIPLDARKEHEGHIVLNSCSCCYMFAPARERKAPKRFEPTG